MCDTAGRRMVRERWHELVDFVDPVQRLLDRDAAKAPPPAPAAAPPLAVRNLYATPPAPPSGELFERLAEMGTTVVERITSSAHPDGEVYVQEQDEWVVLLRGEATLEVDGRLLHLDQGDSVLLPARTPHRVRATSAGALWLAVHVHPR